MLYDSMVHTDRVLITMINYLKISLKLKIHEFPMQRITLTNTRVKIGLDWLIGKFRSSENIEL